MSAPSRSPAMARVERLLSRVARSDATVLLTGETGTGKGVAARALHTASPRADGPFVHVDCAGLAATVIESELFGHERGAFTGALTRRTGRLEQAAGGTLFLDEIADLTPALQGKLLRVLQDREFERVGGTRTLRLAARVVAATSCDLSAAVAAGRFRPDLYYRLAVVEVTLPPLRERTEDLPELVRAGVARLAPAARRMPPAVGDGFLDALAGHAWPGNVRELMNLLERLLAIDPGAVLDAALLRRAGWAPRAGGPCAPPAPPPGRPLPPSARPAAGAAHEREALLSLLRETGGNVSRAARRLGLPRGTLRHRLLRHGLAAHVPRD